MTPSPPGRRPTQRDIAERAGVSTATVSYVLSGRRGGGTAPTPQTREHVLRAAAEIGYERDHIARSLRRQRSDVVALMYPAPSSPWSDRLAEQLQAAAAALAITVVALPVTATMSSETILRPLRERFVDGAVLLPDCPIHADDLALIAARGVSLVVFDDELAPAGFDVVRQNRRRACREGVDRLVAAGHRRIAYLAHEHEHAAPDRSVKYRSYLEGLDAAGIKPEPSLMLPVADSRSKAHAAVRRLLEGPNPPTAIYSATDRAAIDAMWAAREAGIGVPAELEVVGVGNIPEGLMVSPALTTVGMPDLDFTPVVERFFTRLAAETPMDDATLEAPWRLIARESG